MSHEEGIQVVINAISAFKNASAFGGPCKIISATNKVQIFDKRESFR